MDKKTLNKEILSYLYESGMRYIARDLDGGLCAYEDKPILDDENWIGASLVFAIDIFSDLFEDLNRGKLLSIGQSIGIFDWEEISIDTPVLVSHDGKYWERRHFSRCPPVFKSQPYSTFAKGNTSWTDGLGVPEYWEHCKVPEEYQIGKGGLNE